ncbi:MAG: ABC transporter permease [Chloroflexi bacterium]|nr:ABC transporter permease [Chloroflexota bacterium]
MLRKISFGGSGLGFMLIVFIAALIINFAIPRLMPGDITDVYLTTAFDSQTSETLMKRFGLDQPQIVQFGLYLRNIFTGDFGVSLYRYPKTVSSMLAEAIPKSLALIIPSQIIYVLIGYFLGVKAGWKAGSKTDSIITGLSMLIWAAPMFWVAMIILYIFGFWLSWFPLGGYETIGAHWANGFGRIGDLIYHAILPMFTLILCRFGSAQMVMRNTITITLKENYITTARAKGLSENRVKHRHAARNALLPLVTSTTFGVSLSVSGSIFIEKIFSYPGVGRMTFDAVVRGDYPVIQGCFLIFTVMIIVVVVLLDLIYARLDPRVRFG